MSRFDIIIRELETNVPALCDVDLEANNAQLELSNSSGAYVGTDFNESNGFTDEQFTSLLNAFSEHKTLKTINLSNNKLTDAHAQLLIKMLKVNDRLETMNISKNLISVGAQATMLLQISEHRSSAMLHLWCMFRKGAIRSRKVTAQVADDNISATNQNSDEEYSMHVNISNNPDGRTDTFIPGGLGKKIFKYLGAPTKFSLVV